ncbi:MAG: hypothetical protein U0Y82_15180 [Thermoleophilia bacterium]
MVGSTLIGTSGIGTPSRLRRSVAAMLVCLMMVLSVGVLAGCGSSSSSSNGATTSKNTPAFAKTRFLLHAGLAIGAFHRYIYKPAKAGSFAQGAPHRRTTIVKAALAGAFVVYETNKALKFAKADPTLSKVVVPLTALSGALGPLVSKIKGGNLSAGDITSIITADSAVQDLNAASSAAGAVLNEQSPSTLQLLHPSSTGN